MLGLKYDELKKLIRDNGWIKIRQMGTSHVIYRKGSRTYPVPYHRGREVGTGLEHMIRKEMELK
ncbi:MAG: type II toxin-antitoxin system HicA family toxin [Bacteroidales bacterium]|nr:type II toxin-antitoxin system HicA family toxin [Bacteroidales bacterium]